MAKQVSGWRRWRVTRRSFGVRATSCGDADLRERHELRSAVESLRASAIVAGMTRWSRKRLARAVTMVLLLWTAVDLTNSSLCALENEDTRSSAPAVPGSTARDQDSSSRIPQQPATPHIDDCFCCSHCVEVQGLVPALASMPVNRDVPPIVLAAPRLFGSRLYHPPLL